MTKEEIKAFADRIYKLSGKIQGKYERLIELASETSEVWSNYDDHVLDLLQIIAFLDKLYLSIDRGKEPSRADIIQVNSYEVMYS